MVGWVRVLAWGNAYSLLVVAGVSALPGVCPCLERCTLDRYHGHRRTNAVRVLALEKGPHYRS